MGYFCRSDFSLLVYVVLSGPKLISWIELIFKNWEEQFHVPIKQCFKWYLRHLRKFFSKGSISFHVGCYVKLPRKSETFDFVMLSAVRRRFPSSVIVHFEPLFTHRYIVLTTLFYLGQVLVDKVIAITNAKSLVANYF